MNNIDKLIGLAVCFLIAAVLWFCIFKTFESADAEELPLPQPAAIARGSYYTLYKFKNGSTDCFMWGEAISCVRSLDI